MERVIDKEILEGKIRRILSDNLDVDVDSINGSSHLQDDLGMDSFDALRLIFEVEGEFDIKVPPTGLPPIKTVAHIVDFLLKRIAAQQKEING